MIPTSIIFRTIHLKYNNSNGSCFVLDYDKKQYFITAKHIIDKITVDATIEFYYNNQWNPNKVKLIGHSTHSDISVFIVPEAKIGGDSIIPTSDDIFYSQQIYFLGFPYGITNVISNVNNNFPVPFVKSGILSNITINKTNKILYLDGINNPGFSGGPIVFLDKKDNSFKLCGVISGFRFETQKATLKNRETDVEIKVNTGIIIGYGIEAAIDLINANPTGRLI